MFFDLSMHLKNWYTWLRFRKIDEKKIKKIFPLKEIKDNRIILDKNKLAVLKIEPINFQIKPEKEQEAIIISFQKFLNSLDFPIQFLMTTETLNLNEYLSIVKGKMSDNAKDIFIEYQEHLKNFIKNNSVMNRSFYLVIPEKSNLEIQTKICEERLNNLNLKTTILNKNEIESIFNKICNTHENLLPKNIDNQIDLVKVDGGILNRTIFAHGYPRIVESGFLDKIVSCSGNFDLSLHIEPYPLEMTMIMLNKELQKQRADLYSAKIKNQFNPSLEIKYADTQKILENLQKGKEKLFNISFYINCKAENLEELNLLTKKIESELNSLLILPKQPKFRMFQGFKSCLPLADNSLKMKRNITTSALSAFFPFTSSFFKFDKTGIWFGLNKNNIPIIKDIFKLSNANGICLATSGSGKSYLAKLLITRHLLSGTKVTVIDPQSEYVGLVKRFNGQRIDLSRTSDTIINPLDLMGHSYPEKRLALMDLMPVMLGDLTEPQKSFIDKALTEAYNNKGIEMNDESTWDNKPPILEDVLNELFRLEKRAITLEKTTIRSLINRLDIYVNGVFSFLNKHSNINFNNKFVCFDIGNMPKQVKPVIMFLVLDYVYMKMKSDLERKLLVIDEAWALLSRTEDASYIFEIVKTCRKFNLGLFLINQEVEGMLSSEAGRSVLANSSYTLLLRQKPAVIEGIQETFHLSNSEKVTLLTAGVGEGLLLMEDDHSEIKIVSSEAEHKQITTNADEILADKEKQKPTELKQEKSKLNSKASLKPKVVNISVDASKGFYRHKDLKLDDLKYLLSRGYKEYSFYSILSNKKERYILKPRFNESPQHFFLTCDIANYLKKFTSKVELFVTKKPDIVFTINNKKYAVEIETGKIKDNKKLKEKAFLLNKEYGNNWFFVVTDKNLVSKYSQLGRTFEKRNIASKILQIAKNNFTDKILSADFSKENKENSTIGGRENLNLSAPITLCRKLRANRKTATKLNREVKNGERQRRKASNSERSEDRTA
jgi:conjugal transfer ATP-binding protein TraC